MTETIKVVIRFKGREQLTDEEARSWTVTESDVNAPNYDPKAKEPHVKFTFDRILDNQTT